MVAQHITLFSTLNGSIYKFIDTELFQIDFGNIILTVKKENIESLTQFLLTTDPDNLTPLIVQPSNKILIQAIGFRGCYAFTESEFVEFRELIIGAHAMIAMDNEISLALTKY